MDRRILVVGIAAMILIVGVATTISLANNNGSSEGDFVDAAGRSVSIPDDLSRGIVTAGPGALRFVSYFGETILPGSEKTVFESVVMVDKGDAGKEAGGAGNQGGKTYQYAYGYMNDPNLKWHTHNAIENSDVSSILEVNPSLIVVTDSVYNTYKTGCDALAKEYTVVVIYELEEFFYSDFTLSEKFENQINNLGIVFKDTERSKEIIDGVNDIVKDIRTMVDGKESDKVVYVAGVAYGGAKPLTYSTGDFSSLNLINANNVVPGNDGVKQISVSDLLSYDIDIILIDPLYKEEVSSDSKAFIDGFKDVDKYTILPYFWFGQNLENILGNAYFIANLIYDDLNVDYNKKVEQINKLLLGEKGADAFNKMNEWSETNTKNGAQMSLFENVVLS